MNDEIILPFPIDDVLPIINNEDDFSEEVYEEHSKNDIEGRKIDE